MLVSVIIPLYNAEKWIAKTLDSVLKQKFLKEIIIIDDHSSDKSFDIAMQYQKKFPQLIKVYKNIGKGANNARNYGFEKSSGKFIQWLDADDQLLDKKFETQLKILEKQNVDIVYSDWYMDFYDENLNLKERKKVKKAKYDDFLYELLKDNWVANMSYLLKREIAEKLHKLKAWNPQTKIAQDREYFTIAALEGAKFAYAEGFFSVYNRWNKKQISAANFKFRLENQLQMEKKFKDLILQKIQDKKLQKKYIACLNAHILNALYYYPSLKMPYKFSIFNVNWEIIHWKKYPFIPFIYLFKIFSK